MHLTDSHLLDLFGIKFQHDPTCENHNFFMHVIITVVSAVIISFSHFSFYTPTMKCTHTIRYVYTQTE